MPSTQDRIQKEIHLKAAPSKVWKALSDAEQFGAWFRVKLDGAFVEGEAVSGHITYPGYEHLRFWARVERMQPEKSFAMRWHPNAVDPDKDYSDEPLTLVEFELEAVDGGTRLTVTESGFDQIPEARRREAFLSNSEGWQIQLTNIQEYLRA